MRFPLQVRDPQDKIGKGGDIMEKLEQLKKWVAESSRIVFFGGAGVSTE